jgi:hypothetical protein
VRQGRYRFDRSFALGTVGRYLAALLVLALLEAAGRLGFLVYGFVTEAEDRAATSAHELASDVRDIMINRGGPVAARTVYPILERIYEDAGYRIAIDPSEETVASIEETFGFMPQGVPPEWPEGWFQEGSVDLEADDFCLQCHVRAEVGSVLGTVTCVARACARRTSQRSSRFRPRGWQRPASMHCSSRSFNCHQASFVCRSSGSAVQAAFSAWRAPPRSRVRCPARPCLR